MARTVEEIMNPEVFCLRPDEAADQALDYIVELGITGAPVTNSDRTVLGHASLRDLAPAPKGTPVGDRMKSPAHTVRPTTAIDEAGRLLVSHRVHRLIVVDGESRVAGIVSAVDVIAALLGLPVVHPSAFPHFDRETGIIWTDEAELTQDAVSAAPDEPGVFVLIEVAPLRRDWIAWIDQARDIRSRLYDLLSRPQEDPLLARLLASSSHKLRFRAAPVEDDEKRNEVVALLKERAMRWPGSPFRCETGPSLAEGPIH